MFNLINTFTRKQLSMPEEGAELSNLPKEDKPTKASRKNAAKSAADSQSMTEGDGTVGKTFSGRRSAKLLKEDRWLLKVPEKSSARLQNLKNQQNFTNASIDEVLQSSNFNNQLTFSELVERIQRDLIDPNHLNIEKELYFYKHFRTSDRAGGQALMGGFEGNISEAMMNLTNQNIQFGSQLPTESEDAKKIQEIYYCLLNHDFREFIQNNNCRRFLSLNHLAAETLEHFFSNSEKTIPNDIEEFSLFSAAPETLSICPSFYLTESRKENLLKIFYYNSQLYHGTFNENYTALLTMLELLIDYYTYRSGLPNRDSLKKKEKIAKYQSLMKDIAYKLLLFEFPKDTLKNYSEKQLKILKVRTTYAIAKLYTLEAFNSPDVAKMALELLESELEGFETTTTSNALLLSNAQSFDKNIVINVFWTKDKLIDNEKIEKITEKMREHEIRNKLSESKKSNFEDEQLSMDIQKIYEDFENKLKSSSEESIDASYTKLFEKLSVIKLETFIIYFTKIFGLFLEMIFKKPEFDDTKKIIVHAYQQLKINSLLQLFQTRFEPKVMSHYLKRDHPINGHLIELFFLLIKAYCVNIITEYVLDFELMFENLLKIGLQLVKVFESEYKLASYKFLRTLHTLLEMVPPDRNEALYPKIERDFRQDAIFTSFKYLQSRYTNYLEKEREERRMEIENENPEAVKEERLYDEIEEDLMYYFVIWYGASMPELAQQTQVATAGDSGGVLQFAPENFLDVYLFVKYIEYYTPEYMQNPNNKFKAYISKYMLKIYKFLQNHEKLWYSICPGVIEIKERFQKQLESGKIAMDQKAPSELLVNTLSDDCFCSGGKCFTKLKTIEPNDFKQLFRTLFFLCGKAYDDTRTNDVMTNIFTYRKHLQRMEKIYVLNVSFYVMDPYSCWRLASTLLEGYTIYSDQNVYPLVHEKLQRFGSNFEMARGLLNHAFTLTKSQNVDKQYLQFPDIPFESTYLSVLQYLKVLLIIECQTLKYKRYFHKGATELVSEGTKIQATKSINRHLKEWREELMSLPIATEDIKDFYISMNFIRNKLPEHFCFEENIKIIKDLQALKGKFEINYNNLNSQMVERSGQLLNEMEAHSQYYIVMVKILRQYIYIIKYLQDKSLDKKKIEEKLAERGQGVDLEYLKRKIFQDLEEFMNHLLRDESIKFEQGMVQLEGTTSVDKNLLARPMTMMMTQEEDSQKMSIEPPVAMQEELNMDLERFVTSNGRSIFYSRSRSKVEKTLTAIIENLEVPIIQKPEENQSQDLIIEEVSINPTKLYSQVNDFIIFLLKRIRKLLAKKDIRKLKGAPFYTNCTLIMARLYEEFFGKHEKALELVSEFFSAKCNEVVDIYKYEKDFKLGFLYNREVMFLKKKHKIVENYLRLAPYGRDKKEVLERIKLINKKASSFLFPPEDQEKKSERVNLAFWGIYTQTMRYILESLKKFYEKENKALMKNEKKESKLSQEEEKINIEKVDEGLKNEMKYLNELIATNIKSKNIAPIFKKQAELKTLLDDMLVKALIYYSTKLGAPVYFVSRCRN